jgi:hypothetical protein
MKQIERLQEIYKILKTKKVNLTEIRSSLSVIGIKISIRQLQRDLQDIANLSWEDYDKIDLDY